MELVDQVKLSVMKVMRLGFPSTLTIASIRRRVSGYQTQVHFRRRFPPAMFRPIQTVGDQLNLCRINYMDHALEASRQRTVSPALNPEVRTDLIQMSKNFPEQFFRHTCVAIPVCMGQTIPAR